MQPPHPTDAIPMERALEVFVDLASQRNIAFGYLEDGCHARAHLMVQRLLHLGLPPRKVWAFARSKADMLWVHPPRKRESVVIWAFHVAPAIHVQDETGFVRDMVLEPALFDRPVTIDEWCDALHDTPRIVQTAL